MLRKIVKINESLCNGCGLCVSACAEGALQLVNGKARLVKESYCDGLGACLPKCPADAIEIVQREADAFDEDEVREHLVHVGAPAGHAGHGPHAAHHGGACPGSALREMKRPAALDAAASEPGKSQASELSHWPVQLRLVPPSAPFLAGADLVVAADCTAFALGDFHNRYLKGRALLVGCPKLDDIGYYEDKLKDIFAAAKPRAVTVVRMEVPCCGGIAAAVVSARDAESPGTPVTVETISIGGEVLRRQTV